jgi:hypothetical protein
VIGLGAVLLTAGDDRGQVAVDTVVDTTPLSVPESTSHTTFDDETVPPFTQPGPSVTRPETSLPPAPPELEDLVVGESTGEEAVGALRSAGYVVFDYAVCSNSVPEPGLLRQVRLTSTQRVVLGGDDDVLSSSSIPAGESLDVLVTTGDPC